MQQFSHTNIGRCLNAGEQHGFRQVVALAIIGLPGCVSAWSDTPASPAANSHGDSVAAVWTPKELNFSYHGFTTKYSCDGLRVRMHDLLLELGARSDVRVRSYGCTRAVGPDPFAGVDIKMNVLRPATQQHTQIVAAHWQAVDLRNDRDFRDPEDAAANCELISQIKQEILPLFTTRNVDYSATCEHHHVVVGGTRLKADVLKADQNTSASAAETGYRSSLGRVSPSTGSLMAR